MTARLANEIRVASALTWAAWGRNLAISLCAAMICAAVFSIGVDRIPVTDRDEARFAQASKQMAASGDIVDIRFQDQPRYKKPIGIYWIQSLSTRVFGKTEDNRIWIYRVPSVLAAACAAVALAWAGRPLVGSRAAGFAAIMLASTFLVHVEARLAKTDAALLLCVILVMGALARCWLRPSPDWRIAVVFWTALSAGMLLKGPVILLPVVGTILWCACRARRWAWLAGLRPRHGVLWMLALVAPWYIAISLQSDGAFLSEALGQDFLPKLASGQESHGAPPGAYLATFFLMGWPWSVLTPAAAVLAAKTWQQPETLFVTGWILPAWIALEVVPTKLLHYPLPVFPAILLLSASALTRKNTSGVSIYAGLPIAGIAALILTVIAVTGPIWYGGAPNWYAIGIALVALACAAIGGVAYLAAKDRHALVSFALAGVLMAVSILAVALPAMSSLFPAERIYQKTWCHTGPIHFVGYAEPSAVFRLGTDVSFSTREHALAALRQDPHAVAWIVVDAPVTGQSIQAVNVSTATDLTLQLYVVPGHPATEPLCGDPA